MRRLLPLLAVLPVFAASSGCVILADDGRTNCSTDLRNYGITLTKNAPMALSEVSQIMACIDTICVAAGPADGAGARNFGDPVNGDMPRGQVTLTSAGASVTVNAVFQMNERNNGYNSVSIRLTSTTGMTQIVTGTVTWTMTSDQCHGVPKSTIAS